MPEKYTLIMQHSMLESVIYLYYCMGTVVPTLKYTLLPCHPKKGMVCPCVILIIYKQDNEFNIFVFVKRKIYENGACMSSL